jgi:hypothetical protein
MRAWVARRVSSIVASASVVSMALGACGDRAAPSCRLGAEHEVARVVARDFDGVALVPVGEGAVAVWSIASGLFVRAVDEEGRPGGAPVRLGERCEGGLAALADEAEIDVACLVLPRRGKHHEPGAVLVHRLDAGLRVVRTESVGGAGAQSEGVALARGARGLELAWHDGSPDAQRVMWSARGESFAEPRALSEADRIAQAPSMLSVGGRAVVVWAESFAGDKEFESRVVAWNGSGAPRTLLERAHVAAMPQLFVVGDALGLGYRHRADGRGKTGLYLAKVAPDLSRLAPAVRAGRADGIGRPTLEPCMGGLLAATPRTYGGDYFVGVNWFDDSLRRARGEQQFYEDSHAFTRVAGACLKAQALLLIAEFPQLHRNTAALRAVSYRCR